MAGQIIIVSGTSGSGKSTTCELFAKRSSDFWLLYGIDAFMASTFPSKFGHHGPLAASGVYAHPVDEADPDGPLRWSCGEHGRRAFAAFHEWIASASRQDCNIIVDHLMMTDPPVLKDCVSRLQGLPVLFVTLKPSYDVLEKRVHERKMGKRLPADLLGTDTARKIVDRLDRLRPFFYETIYANECQDLLIDTVAHGPEEVCDMIERRLAEGPGTAFATLWDALR